MNVEKHRCVGDTDRVQDLFWAHPKSIQLAQCFPNVFLMDCTYKTNRYRMPSFEIVGVTSTMMTFSVAFVYLDSEKEENYIWALASMKSVLNLDALPSIIVTDKEVALMNAIKKIFPNARNFLCRYHISRNILARCKKMFEDGEKWNEFLQGWNEIVHSSTVEEYSHNLSAFEGKFMKYPNALTYVKDNWLMRYKECFVVAWTDQSIHFGNTTANKVESSHARLKRHLGSSQGNLETSWSTINSLLSLLHSEIHASFERSLNIVMHNYTPDIFKELRGFVSRAALDIIVDESKRADSIGPDAQSCMCVRRRTHGLPCAHEIANYKREGRPIPLNCIHYHWKKLSSWPTQMSSNPELDCTPLIDLFLKKFEKGDENIKIQLMKKLKEIVAPESSSLSVPNEKLNTRGRPSSASFKRFAQTEASTKRDPSAFEFVLSTEEKKSQRVPPRKKLNVHRTQIVKHNSNMFLDSFPSVLLPIIQCVKDVKADGNCGFRAIAKLLGKHKDEWRMVRWDLAVELQFHRREYTALYGNEQRVDELMNILNYSGSEPAAFEKWMTIPDMGYLIASRYNMVLCTFSIHLCLTFLPLRSAPDSSINQKVVAIGFVNGNHFVEVVLSENSPLPPISLDWYRARHPLAAGWEDIYVEHIEQFKKIMREENAQWDSPIEVHD